MPELDFEYMKFKMPTVDSSGVVSRQLEWPEFCEGYLDAKDPELALEELIVQL